MTLTKEKDGLGRPPPTTLLPRKRPLHGEDTTDDDECERPILIRRPSRRNCTNYTQACLLLHAIELNRRQTLHPRCIAYLANYVVKAWETHPDEIKVRQLYQLMQKLLTTTAIQQPTLEKALFWFCQNTASTPTPCPNVTLLIAIGYIERLNKKCDRVRGTVGCGSRLIMIAYLMAAKFLHDNLQLIIHTSSSVLPTITTATTLSSKSSSSSSSSPYTRPKERYLRIMRLELEFMYFLDHDLSTADPAKLVRWAQTFDTPAPDDDSTSADEGDDEMDDNDDDDTCTLD